MARGKKYTAEQIVSLLRQESSGGLALRFARVKRYRPDKKAEEADTIETVRALYERRLNKEG